MTITERANDLLDRSYAKNIYTYSDFLTSAEQAEVLSAAGDSAVEFFGGCDFAERKKARFGRKEDISSASDYSLTILKISPRGVKFADDISHRDVLGATLNLGVERGKIGDIFVRGGEAYIIVDEKIKTLIVSELKKVGRNPVEINEAVEIPESFRPERQKKAGFRCGASSRRDCRRSVRFIERRKFFAVQKSESFGKRKRIPRRKQKT